MKISLYTFFVDIGGKYLIYNSLSNALVELEEDVYSILENDYKGKKEINPKTIDEELLNVLQDKYFIIENEQDDVLLYKSIVNSYRRQNVMFLTIAPTMDCNYTCHYCFEKREKIYLDDERINAIVNYVSLQKHIKHVKIVWFGGEPLLALNQIEDLYFKLREIEGKEYDSRIITNGYFLNREVLERLVCIGVSSMQITLDGNKSNHNNVKFTLDCKDTFSKTLNNIDLVLREFPDLYVDLRVNITRKNTSDYKELYDYLKQRYASYKNFSLYPGFVCDTCGDCSDICLSRKEKVKYIMDLYKNGVRTAYSCYPGSLYQECAIRNENTIAFDPEGYAYKCWEIMGNKQYAIGRLNKDGNIIDVNRSILNRYHYGADPLSDKKCSSCSYLPVCCGGCPHERLENLFNGKKHDVCTYLKGYMSEILGMYLRTRYVDAEIEA